MNNGGAMDFYDLVSTRCSIRSFEKSRAIPEEVLNRVLNAGRLAPSANNLQPWHFHVVTSPEMLEKIYPCYNNKKKSVTDILEGKKYTVYFLLDSSCTWPRRRLG